MQRRFHGKPDIERLTSLAQQIRRDSLRMINNAGAGHIGGALGLADIMAVLYGWVLEYDSRNLAYGDRDRVVLSNGHTCAAWYSVLARTGFIDPDELSGFRRMGSRLQGHPARKALPGLVETSTGPLGQGFSVANGIALSRKADKSSARVYCIVGDGELQEGQVWEAAMTAAHYQLSNLILIVTDNGLQIDGKVAEVMGIQPLEEKFRGFGWQTQRIDGHDMQQIISALHSTDSEGDKPWAILASTIMGKGVSLMENLAAWHGTWPDNDQTRQGLEEIGSNELYRDFQIPEERAVDV